MKINLVLMFRNFRIEENPSLSYPNMILATKKPQIDSAFNDLLYKAMCLFQNQHDKLSIYELSWIEIIQKYQAKYSIDKIICDVYYDSKILKEQSLIQAYCKLNNIKYITINSNYLWKPNSILSKQGTPYKIFNYFYRSWQQLTINKRTKLGTFVENKINKHKYQTTFASIDLYNPSEDQAKLHLLHNQILSYHINCGTISIYTILDSKPDLQRSICWRDFCANLAYHYPKILTEDFYPKQWSQDLKPLKQWEAGNTEFNNINEYMRRFNQTGFLTNRERMIVAFALTKHYKIPWQYGLRYFKKHLIDHDESINAYNWQWISSTGPNSMAPYKKFKLS